MKTLITAAVAATFVASAASAETYRLDIAAAEGVKFAPWANAEAVDLYTLAINGSPAVAQNGLFADVRIPGVASEHGSWFIFEANKGDTITLAAMQGNSVDEYGVITIELPMDVANEDKVEMVEELVDEMNAEGRIIRVLKMVEKRTPVADTPADRSTSGDIAGFDAGADEGTEVATSVDNKGTWTVVQLGK